MKKLKENGEVCCDNNRRDMKNLPEDVIILILAKLQVKPLMRFRCVCKSWCALIRSPNFIELHERSSKKHECILAHRTKWVSSERRRFLSFHSYESLKEISNLKVPYLKEDRFDVSWPCKGLLLFASDYRDILVLCNPATRDFKLLPANPFHVSYSVSSIGLCFDFNENDYKVVIRQLLHKSAEVYSVSSNCWRQIQYDDMPYMDIGYNPDPGVALNGVLHWDAKRDEVDIILCFDVNTELFQDIQLPRDLIHYNSRKTPIVISDSLALFEFNSCDDDDEPNFLEIWVMKEYNVVGSWTKIFSISRNLNTVIWESHLLCLNGAILIETITDNDHFYYLRDRKLVWCALDTQEMTDTDTGIISDGYVLQRLMVYKESLVSIN